MNELSLKLKNDVINRLLTSNEDLDEKYISIGVESYSRRELASEIENETKNGIKILTNMVMLAFDISSRKNKTK